MKIYTIVEAVYMNTDGDWPGDELEALGGTAKSFRRKDSAMQEVMDWIHDTIAEFYNFDESDIEDTYNEARRSVQYIPDSEFCHKKEMVVWELQLCGRVYKWEMFSQTI